MVEDPSQVAALAPESIAPLLATLAGLQTALAARLLTFPNGHRNPDGEDRLLTVHEAAILLNVSPDWLYRRAPRLPFTVHLGRHLRFSSVGIARYIRQRQGRYSPP